MKCQNNLQLHFTTQQCTKFNSPDLNMASKSKYGLAGLVKKQHNLEILGLYSWTANYIPKFQADSEEAKSFTITTIKKTALNFFGKI